MSVGMQCIFLLVPHEEHALTPPCSAFKLLVTVRWKSLDNKINSVFVLILQKKWLHSAGELTDWNEPDLSCVIIIRLAVAHTSSNYFRQKGAIFKLCTTGSFCFHFHWIYTMFCTLYMQQAICAVLSLGKNLWKASLFFLICALLRLKMGRNEDNVRSPNHPLSKTTVGLELIPADTGRGRGGP